MKKPELIGRHDVNRRNEWEQMGMDELQGVGHINVCEQTVTNRAGFQNAGSG